MIYNKYAVHVVDTKTGHLLALVKRRLRAEQIGNFSPIFCTYLGNDRCLVHAVEGDLSDPFRREESYLTTLYIEI